MDIYLTDLTAALYQCIVLAFDLAAEPNLVAVKLENIQKCRSHQFLLLIIFLCPSLAKPGQPYHISIYQPHSCHPRVLLLVTEPSHRLPADLTSLSCNPPSIKQKPPNQNQNRNPLFSICHILLEFRPQAPKSVSAA